MKKLLLSGIYCLVIGSCFAQPIANLASTDTVPLDPAVKYGRLANGFTYYIQNTGTPGAGISMNLVVDAGIGLEDSDQLQISHLIEHMSLFRASKHFPQGTSNYGKSKGFTYLNGATGFPSTRYEFTMPDEKLSLIDTALLILFDWAQGSLLLPKDVDEERGALIGEMRESGGAQRKINEQKFFAILRNKEYAPGILDRITYNIQHFQQSVIERYYKEWYRPDLQAVIIVGNIDASAIEEKVKKKFADLVLPAIPLRKINWQEKYKGVLDGSNNIIRITDKEMREVTVDILNKQRSKTYLVGTVSTVDGYRMLLIDELYNLMVLPRIEQITRRYNAPAKQVLHNVDRAAIQGAAQIDVLSTSIVLDTTQSIKNALQLSLNVLECVKRNGFSQDEFDSAKNMLVKKYSDNTELDPQQTISEIQSRYIDHFRYGAAAPSKKSERELFLLLLNQVTLDSVNNFAKSWLANTVNNDIVIVAPEGLTIPGDTEIKEWVSEVSHNSLDASKCQVNTSKVKLSENIPVSAINNNYKQSAVQSIGVTELKLDNGIRILLKPMVSQGYQADKILLKGMKRGGAANYTGADYSSASFCDNIISNSGVDGWDKFQLQKFCTEKDISLSTYVSNDWLNFTGFSSHDNLKEMLNLLRLYITSPNKNKEAFNDWQRTSSLRNVITVATEFEDSINVKQGVKKIGAGPSYKNVQFERAYQIYKELFSDVRDFTFVLSGDFKIEEIKPLLIKYLGSIPAKIKSGVKNNSSPAKASFNYKIDSPAIAYNLYRGKERGALVRLICSGHYQPGIVTDFQHKILANILNETMFQRLRVKEGGVYGIAASSRLNQPERAYVYRIEYACDTTNVEKLIAAARDEVHHLRQSGPEKDLLNRVKAVMIQDHAEKLKSNYYWFNFLVDSYQNGNDPTDMLKIPALIDALNPESVRALANKYLDENYFSRFVLYPEE